MKNWDAIVIGSGQGGNPLARNLAIAGWKTALIEREHFGGTCINVGCTPTKTMISDARLAQQIREAPGRGIMVGDFSIDLTKIVRRKNDIVESFRTSIEKGFGETPNLTVIRGDASFLGPRSLKVRLAASTEEHRASHIFINTGCSPSIPQLEGLEGVPYLTSTSILDMTDIPAHLIVLGGGYIALEMGQLFRRLGSEVSLIERGNALLSREDADIQTAVREILEGEGMLCYLGASLKKVSADGGGVSLVFEQEGKILTLEGSHLLVATGRTPRTKDLHLEIAGVATDDHGFIKTDEYLCTNVPGIYALGDVKGGPAFTHISYNDYLILFKNLINGNKVSIKDRMVPYCVFIDPALGRIGLTENEARARGLSFKTAVLPMTRVARAIETGHTKGMMKALVDTETRQVLGAAILGDEGGEVMSVLQMAMVGKIPYDQIKEMVFAHPLYSESLNNLFMTLDKNNG